MSGIGAPSGPPASPAGAAAGSATPLSAAKRLISRVIFSATKVNLNIWSSVFHDGLAEKKDFVNPRTFEICACGGFQLADASAPVERFFEPGVELVTFGSIDEARDKARYFLRHDAERAAIAERGRLRAHAEHTYDQRLAGALGRVWERTEKLQRRVVDRGGRPHA